MSQDLSQGQEHGQGQEPQNGRGIGVGSGLGQSNGLSSGPSSSLSNVISASPYLSALSSFLLQRFLFSRETGYGFNTQFGGKRNLNTIFGYDDYLDIAKLRYQYERGGIAHRIVEILPDATWGVKFDVKDDPNLKRRTPFERSFERLYSNHKLSFHQKLVRASKLAYLGRYSIIFIGAPGDHSQELDIGRMDVDDIKFLMPLGEDKVRIAEVVGQNGRAEDAYDERFGQPLFYNINLSGFGRRRSGSGITPRIEPSPIFTARKVHWTRVIHIVRAPLDSEIECLPILSAVWDLLFNLAKVTGGGAESELRRAWPTLHADFDKDFKADKPLRDEIKEQLNNAAVGLENSIRSRGMTLKELYATGRIDIKSNCEAIEEQIATTLGIPTNQFRGSQLGLRSSQEDRKIWLKLLKNLRSTENDPVVRNTLNRLVDFNYMPKPKNENWEIIWSEEEEMDLKEKGETAKVMKESESLSDDEIRDMVWDLEPREQEQKINQPVEEVEIDQ